MQTINIGTSGWHYQHWRGVFYPHGMAAVDMLSYYSRHFTTVEVNNAFYQLPTEDALENWRTAVPKPFCFSLKASRYITHMKKLKDFQEPLARLLDRIGRLKENLGPILFQLPPRWKFNPERLAAFAGGLPGDYRFVLEFRDPSWYDRRAMRILAGEGIAMCLHDMPGSASPRETTADFVYVRLHGPQKYGGSYDRQALAGWAGAFSTWQRQGKTIYCYFNNDAEGHAVNNALRLKKMLNA